ncbi:MAG: phosphate ABC transporter permease subunit PstC [Elusimicrobiota bacterium]|nr:phosphate ABC transporter permease subunit PstC [Elusimicrobiota bacterium]
MATAVLDRVRTVPGSRERAGDRLFRRVIAGFAGIILLATAALAWQLARESAETWKTFGLTFLWTSDWDPVADVFGALPFLYGTAVSSLLALLIAVPLGVGAAVFLTELAPKRLAEVLMFAIELLAAVPSVILGLMGIFLLVPAMRALGAPYGVGMLTAGLILAFMILPYITTITREVLLTVPRPLKEAMYALGATRWEVVRGVSLPYSRSGIVGAVFLSLGRALGETMAVTMVIGNNPQIKASLLEPGYSMAAVIANELAEAASDAHLSALVAIGLTLMALTVLVNGAARLMLYRLGSRK